MSIQDRLERILRDLLIMVSKAPATKKGSGYVMVHKKEMQQQLGNLRDVVQEMMDQYEVTEESRNRRALEVQKQGEQIIRNANHQAQDIYAASVLYTEDALGKIQSIIDEAEKASKNTLDQMRREMEEERRRVRSNQSELLTQLEDLKDTAKYMRLIEDRNREIAKAKAKRAENLKPRRYGRIPSNDSAAEQEDTTEEYVEAYAEEEKFTPIRPEIRVNQEYFKKIGAVPEETEAEEAAGAASTANMSAEKGIPKNGNRPSGKKKSKNKRRTAVGGAPDRIHGGAEDHGLDSTRGRTGSDSVREISANSAEDISEELAAEIVAGIAKEISAELPEEQVDTRYSSIGELPAWDPGVSYDDDAVVYEKPVIKVNPEYFAKINKQVPMDEFYEGDDDIETEPAKEKGTSPREMLQGIFPFGRKS